MDNPTARFIALLLGGFALLCAGFYLGRGTAPVAEPAGGVPANTTAAEAPHNAGPAHAEAPAHHAPPVDLHAGHSEDDGHHHFPPEIPAEGIVPGSSDPRQARDLPGLLSALRAAVAEGDPHAMTECQNAVLEWLRSDEARALETIQAFRKEDAPSVLDILASAIAADPVLAANVRVAEAFLTIAESRDGAPAQRQSALYFLSQAGVLSPALQDRIAAYARVEGDPALQSGAVAALAQVARLDEARAPSVNAQLLDVARSAADGMVRSNALGALTGRVTEDATLTQVAEFLRSDRDSEVRRAAAESLGGVPAERRGPALAALEAAFRSESATEVRRTILISIVRAGRADAAATLERIAGIDPSLARDAQDYLEILATGETDPNRVFEAKSRREAGR